MRAVDFVEKTTKDYVEQMPKAQRKKIGQFFTSKETASYMAALFDIAADEKSISVLDAGAGSGMLAAAVIDRLEQMPQIDTIELVCCENDENVIGLLRSNLEWIKRSTTKKILCEVRQENYILSQAENYQGTFAAERQPQK